MAKAPKTPAPAATQTPAAAPAAPAPVAPWANTDADKQTHTPTDPAPAVPATGDPAPVANSATAPVAEQPSEERDQETPTGDNPSEQQTPGDSEGDNSDADGEGGNGGGDDDAGELNAATAAENKPDDETTSIERDQETPAAPNPSELVEEEAGKIDPSSVVKAPPPGQERPAEVTDQVTPIGQDQALLLDDQRKVSLERSAYPTTLEAIRDRMAALPVDEQATLSAKLAEAADEILTTHERNAQAREMEAQMVDGTALYGNRVRRADHDETLQSQTGNGNAERNRRARRAAERIATAAKAKPAQ